MLPEKQESHLHYQGRSCKGKYFALHWERRALETSDLESNLGLGFLASWSLVLGPWSWFLVLVSVLVVGCWLQASAVEGRGALVGQEKAGSFRLRSGQALGGFASRNDIAQLTSSDGRGQS